MARSDIPSAFLGKPAALLACLAVWIGGGLLSPPVSRAVPHTFSAKQHPYDPDWPDVYLILSQKCAACHRPKSDRADLSCYESIVAARSGDQRVVVPGKPDASLLWQYVSWNAEAKLASDLPETPIMPPEHEQWLTAGQLQTLRRWIARGALEYKLPPTCNIRPLTEISYPSAQQCRVCHPKQYEEWSRSMHAYAQHSPVFEAFNLSLQERTSGTLGTFCTRCHTPLGTSLGENGLRRNVHRSRLSMEGVTCVVCHRQKQPYLKASGRQAIVPGTLYETCVYGPFDDPVGALLGAHDAEGQPMLRRGDFCGSCHDVTNPQGLRLEEAFSEWRNSPAAAQGVTCQHCHMGPVQGVPIPFDKRPLGRAAVVPGVDPEKLPVRHLSDHTFAGPDYSLLPDTEFPHKLDWMYETDYRCPEKLTPYQQKTLKDLRRRNREQLKIADAKRYELLSNAAALTVCAPDAVAPGQHAKIRVEVTSKVPGHNFPTGFTAERQVWVHIVLRDAQGAVLFQAGDFDSNGDLRDDHSHDVLAGKLHRDKHLLNLQSRFIALTFKGTEHSVVLTVNRFLMPLNVLRPSQTASASFGRPFTLRVGKASLPPLGTQGHDYPVRFPAKPGPCRLQVRLKFRHLPPALLDEIGTPQLKRLLEAVVIDEFDKTIDVTPSVGGGPAVLRWERTSPR